MRIMVTGGAGFLGSHLCERLLSEGHEVVCVDNLVTGSEGNIAEFVANPRFTFINHDITTPLEYTEKLDQLYHLASPASPNIHSAKSYIALSFETMQANTTGTWKMCELALATGASFLYSSTSEIYGDPLEHPQKETYRGNVSTTGPRSVYDEAKRFGETIVSAFTRSRGLNGRIIRIFNTYGPRMAVDDGRVVTEFIRAARRNEPLPIFGDGSQTRSFCYVSDLVDGMVRAMNTAGTAGKVFNLGNPTEFTIKELAEQVLALTQSTGGMEIKEQLPTDDPLRRKPDITLAIEHLGWKPVVPLEEGLKKTISLFPI